MITFIGDFVCKVDAKGRFVLPSAFKKLINVQGENRLVVRKDLFESCLVIYAYPEWEAELARIRKRINPYNRQHNRFYRDYFKGSAEVTFDGNGRVLIPRRLLDLAEVDSELVLLGVDNRIELWNKAKYDSAGVDQDELGDLAEEILGNNLFPELEKM